MLRNDTIMLADKGTKVYTDCISKLVELKVERGPIMNKRIIPKIKKLPSGNVVPSIFGEEEEEQKGCKIMDNNKNRDFENEKAKDGGNMNTEKNQDNKDAAFLIQGDADEDTVKSTEPELLPEGNYPATIGELWLEQVTLDNGKSYVKVTVPFAVELESGETRLVYFSGSTNLATTNSRFRPIVKGVLREVPKGIFDVRRLEEKRVLAKVVLNTFNGVTRNQVEAAELLED